MKFKGEKLSYLEFNDELWGVIHLFVAKEVSIIGLKGDITLLEALFSQAHGQYCTTLVISFFSSFFC